MKSRSYFKMWAGFEVFTTVTIQTVIFCAVIMCSFANGYQ